MSQKPKRPVILISGSSADSKSVTAMMAMVRASGADPMLVANHLERQRGRVGTALQEQVTADIAKADGVIVMGNDKDIDPADYRAAASAKTNSENATEEGRARAAYEYVLMNEALNNFKVPLLGVCGGMQRLNVICEGTLHQDIPEILGDNRRQQSEAGVAPFVSVQFVQVQDGTTLSTIADGISGVYTPTHQPMPHNLVMENSMHHQAVDVVGKGLRASAHSIEPDHLNVKIVEAIEADPQGKFKGQYVAGVQWHPEFGASELSTKLIANFTEAAKGYAQAHPLAAEVDTLQETVKSLPQETLAKAQAAYPAEPLGPFTAAVLSSRAATRTR